MPDKKKFHFMSFAPVVKLSSKRLLGFNMSDENSEHFQIQVTRGHNIVVDGRAGSSNPQPHPDSLSTPPSTNTRIRMRVFTTFYLCVKDWWTDQQTSYRVAYPQQKSVVSWWKMFIVLFRYLSSHNFISMINSHPLFCLPTHLALRPRCHSQGKP